MTGRLLAFGPHAGAHRVALRAGVSIQVPLLVLWAVDHQEWSIDRDVETVIGVGIGLHVGYLTRPRPHALAHAALAHAG